VVADGSGAAFSRIIFNFPHALGGLKKQRGLVGRFFASAAPLLAEGGEAEVPLCAGQGGTAADGEKLRTWADSWQVPLLGARAGLVMTRAGPWQPPPGYGARREVGNRDGGGEKTFFVEGAVCHVFERRDFVQLPAIQSPALAGDVCRSRSSRSPKQELRDSRLAETKAALEAALRAKGFAGTSDGACIAADGQASSACASSSSAAVPALLGHGCARVEDLRHGPCHPDPAAVGLCSKWHVECSGPSMEAEVQRTVLGVVGEHSCGALQWRWTGDALLRRLEVLVPRPSRTLCFESGRSAGLPESDWLVAAALHSSGGGRPVCSGGGGGGTEASGAAAAAVPLVVDLEVLAMLRCGFCERRLLGEIACAIDGDRPEGDLAPRRPPAPLHPCAYVHDLRFVPPSRGGRAEGLAEAAEADGNMLSLAERVLKAVREACGELLAEAFQLDPDDGAVGDDAGSGRECRWRLVFDSPGDVLDDRGAYALYQQAREHVRQSVPGIELR